MTTDPIGGVWRYSLDLARGLAQYGCELVLASMGGALSKEQEEEARALPHVTLFSRPYRLEWMDNPWEDVDRAGDWLLSLARETGSECVHLNGYAHASLPWELPVVVVAHSCVSSWWQAVHGSEAPVQYDTYRTRVQAGLNAADAIVAPTQAMLEMLAAQWQIETAKARVIWNGHSPLGSASGKRHASIFSAGRVWDRAKNIQLLNNIAPNLDANVLVAGDASAPAGEAQKHTNITLLGALGRAEMREHLARSMIYAAPARYEPFGLSVLEAASSGCALVLSELPTFRELWHEAALFIPHDDPAQWVKTLNMLLNNSALCCHLGRKAQKRAKRYTISRMAGEYRHLYSMAQSRSLQKQPSMTEIPTHAFSSL